MLEQYLIKYCSPTLASLKTASLFRFPYTKPHELMKSLAVYRKRLAPKGVSILIIKQTACSALIYVYRERQLEADLQKPGVMAFLSQLGYHFDTPTEAISCLMERFSQSEDFPHEVGLFLGYPLWDVSGFIHHQGRNCKLSGHWKVYSHEKDARVLFDRFNHCKAIYQRLWQQGKSVAELTVAA
jgi:hypothetical protein